MTLDKIDIKTDFEHCVYRLTFPNGKFYFGESQDVKKRLSAHKTHPFYKKYASYNYPVYKAIRKYGITNIKVEILFTGTFKECEKVERAYIKKFGTVEYKKTYNVLKGNPTGTNKFTEETKRKIGAASKKRQSSPYYKYKYAKTSGRKIWQYTLDGHFIQEWPNSAYASRGTGILKQTIHSAATVRGKGKEFLWMFAKGSRPRNIKNHRIGIGSRNPKNIKITIRDFKSREILGIYPTIAIAVRKRKVSKSPVIKHINYPEKRKQSYGCIWTRGEDGYENYLKLYPLKP